MTIVITDLYPFNQFLKNLRKDNYDKLILFINKHNILKYAQHIVTDNKSPETASQIFIENIQESMNKHVHIF
jgi:hypothetical protein